MEKKVILIVDDEPNIRLLVKSILSDEYAVIEAGNGNEAYNIVNKEKIDLVLLDIMMPEADGYTVCNAIKNNTQTSSIPVIMVSGLGFDLNKQLAEKIGADGYVTKPFNPEELLTMVRSSIY